MSGPEEMLTVGVISDTHGLLRPEAVEALQGVDHILHAGDIGDAGILKVLRRIAPVTAIRGNVDISGECAALPATEVVELGGLLFYLVHSLADLDINPTAAGVAAVISGHSHRAEVRLEDVLYLNPGSAGPRRFNLPITLANIQIVNRELHPMIIPIELELTDISL
jgi:putative phosphoesterase